MNTKVLRRPEKLPPIHPGMILSEEFLRPMNITQYRLAKSIGVDAPPDPRDHSRRTGYFS